MKVIKDLGLAAMSLFGLFIAVFIGIGLVSKEVEKRSIYSLLAKPIRRQEFVVGKYLGLLLTLFVNLAVMAIAYYAVLGAVAWVDGAWFRPHWEAPAVDPALLKAIAMIFLQLAIVVGDRAVLFHVFQPDARGGADLWPVCRRPLQCRSEELRDGGGLEAGRLSSRALSTTCCRTSRRSTSRARSCTRCQCRQRTCLLNTAYAVVYIVGPRVRRHVHLCAGGISSDAPPADGRLPGGARRHARPGGRRCKSSATGRLPHRKCRSSRSSTSAIGEVMRRAALSYDALLADVYWIRALQHYGGERQKAGSERRYDLLYPLLDLATTLDPRFTVGYRFGAIFLAEPHPGGAGRPDQAIALLKKGVAFNPEQVGLLPRHRVHLLLEPPRLPRTRQTGSPAAGNLPGAPFWLKTLRGRDADARRRSPGIAEPCGRRSARTKKATGCGERRRCGWPSSTRSIRSTC